MKSLSLHSLDEQLAAAISKKAEKESISMNQLAKRLLAEALGLKTKPEGKNRSMFADFCGKWNKEDASKFNSRIADMEQVNPEDWR